MCWPRYRRGLDRRLRSGYGSTMRRSGRRPDTTQVWTFESNWREAGTTLAQRTRVANFTDLPQWFKLHGWWTTNTGKTWHNSVGYNPEDDWSELAAFPSKFAWPGYYYVRACCLASRFGSTNSMVRARSQDVNNTDVSVRRIHHAATLNQPFLVAHGFVKP